MSQTIGKVRTCFLLLTRRLSSPIANFRWYTNIHVQTRLAYSRAWHYVDAGSDPRSLGRLASSIALVLMGKHKPIYDPSTDCGDYVVVAGCHDLRTTGKKRFQKLYYSHNTRPGSLKSMSMDQMFAKSGGGEVLKRAVKGMLPKNRLQEPRLARLKSEFQRISFEKRGTIY